MLVSIRQGIDLATIGRHLTHRPDLEPYFLFLQFLRREYHSGRLTVPAQIDLTEMDSDTAEFIAALAATLRETRGGIL